MSDALDRLAAKVGIEPEYRSLTGAVQRVSDEAKRAILAVMGLDVRSEEALAASLEMAPQVDLGGMAAPDGPPCFMPDWLQDGRCWGVACQVYGLRSKRNWGIGDFEDLARFAENAAAAGADFVGVNPLHALFLSAPERCSPFFPSNRQFLNPLYLAIDRMPCHDRLGDVLEASDDLRSAELVDYKRVAALKLGALDRLFRIFRHDEAADTESFERFCAERGVPLYLHAVFESLSQAMLQQGFGATWHGWPDEFRQPGTDSVRAFAEEQAELVTFHCWLQWHAERQLAEAQHRACDAGMRIGLYLDLAVGVAPDGSATWSDRTLVVPGARIGAPPDYYNAAGQDWGLAPLAPASLVARDFEPFRNAIDTVLRSGGALRIDHAMSLFRLFWIAEGLAAADGVYVRYPFAAMLRTLAERSQARRAIVIGEDLGIVPSGFHDVMRAMEIQSYRVYFFEKKDDRFLPPDAYPREALACITTHDLHTLAGWWSGRDIEVRREIGMIGTHELAREREERGHERRRLLGALSDQGLLPADLAPVMRDEMQASRDMPEGVALGLHRLVARTPARLFAVAAEDLAGETEQVNVPGTMDEHPNWRRKLRLDLDALPDDPLFRHLTEALRDERPKLGR